VPLFLSGIKQLAFSHYAKAALTESFFNGFADFKVMISNITHCGLKITVAHGMMND
jgi:hypothetical protein